MNKHKVYYGIPVPPMKTAIGGKVDRVNMWPFATMRVGGMIKVEYRYAQNAISSYSAYMRNHPGAVFTSRQLPDFLGIWCIHQAKKVVRHTKKRAIRPRKRSEALEQVMRLSEIQQIDDAARKENPSWPAL